MSHFSPRPALAALYPIFVGFAALSCSSSAPAASNVVDTPPVQTSAMSDAGPRSAAVQTGGTPARSDSAKASQAPGKSVDQPDSAGSAGSSAPADTGPVEVTLKRLPEFAEPPVSARMKVRFASANISSGLEELAKSGFGAVETIGDPNDAAGLATTLRAAKSAGIAVDLAPGGSMPYAAPGLGETDSMQQLSRAVSAALMSDGSLSYRSAAPQPSAAELARSASLKLVAVTAARVLDDTSVPVVLDAASAMDLTPMLANGEVQWTVPSGKWLVFGFWQRATGQIPNGFPPFQEPSVWSAQAPMEGFGQNFMADIFASAGIAKALAPLGNLPKETLELLHGTQFAHDSHEVQAEMFWTSRLPEVFSSQRGYSVIQYLPALHAQKEGSFDPLTAGWGTKPPLKVEYTFSEDVGARVRYDYHRTLNDLYVDEYLATFTKALNEHGMSSRAQVAYNYLPLNMTRAGRAVDIPENESLDSGWTTAGETTMPTYPSERWRHALDSYRLTGSGAHLGAGKRATIEFGDDFAIYRKQPIDYAAQLNEGLAGGITQGLLTGFAGVSSAWPGGGGLAGIGIGDFWTTAWPQWRDWQQLTQYFARATVVLETGKPQMDVVIYLDEGIAGVHELTTPKFASDQLELAGFTYDFIDPVTLQAAEASELPGVLFGKGPAYRALVLNQQPRLPSETAQTILAAARGGLRVVIVGEPASASTGFKDAAQNDSAVMQAMQELLSLANVAQVATPDDVAAKLHELGVSPAASYGQSSALMSVHRKTDDGEDIYWVFNPSAEDLAVTASFAAAGTPYALDFWNGIVSRVAYWNATEGRISMPLSVPARGTRAFMFQHQGTPLHVTSTTADGASYLEDALVVRDLEGGEIELTLSDGSSHKLQLTPPPAAMDIRAWMLNVQEISQTGTTQHTVSLSELKDWRDIPELQNAVGSGTYTANIDLPEGWLGADLDIMLEVGAVAGAMQVSVNGMLVTRQTTPGGSWSVKSLLHAGKNAIEVRLDTLLLNRIAASGGGMYETAPSGLLGPVRLIPVALGRVL